MFHIGWLKADQRGAWKPGSMAVFFTLQRCWPRACKRLGFFESFVYIAPVNKNDCDIFNNHKTNKNKEENATDTLCDPKSPNYLFHPAM